MKAPIAALCFLALVPPAAGNGGPILEGVESGEGRPAREKAKTDVTIDEEDLEIDLYQEYAEVRLRYKMRNTGRAVEQDFFFPIEASIDDVSRYEIKADGEALAVEQTDQPEKQTFAEMRPRRVERWRKSVIPFAAGQSREVRIFYHARYRVDGFEVSDNATLESNRFSYRLSPAAGWKEPIGRGQITIRALLAEPENVRIVQPAGRFQALTETAWRWNFTSLRPSQADDLRIDTQPARHEYPVSPSAENPSYYRLVGRQAYLDHAQYEIKSSRTPAARDGESTPTQERFVEVGEILTLTPKNPLPLDAILISPGRHVYNDRAAWYRHGRVAEVEVTLNGKHRFTAQIPNEYLLHRYPLKVRGFAQPVRTVQLKILGVHRGTDAALTGAAISQLGLRARLAKMPKKSNVR